MKEKTIKDLEEKGETGLSSWIQDKMKQSFLDSESSIVNSRIVFIGVNSELPRKQSQNSRKRKPKFQRGPSASNNNLQVGKGVYHQ